MSALTSCAFLPLWGPDKFSISKFSLVDYSKSLGWSTYIAPLEMVDIPRLWGYFLWVNKKHVSVFKDVEKRLVWAILFSGV